jgi:hypothetical protein
MRRALLAPSRLALPPPLASNFSASANSFCLPKASSCIACALASAAAFFFAKKRLYSSVSGFWSCHQMQHEERISIHSFRCMAGWSCVRATNLHFHHLADVCLALCLQPSRLLFGQYLRERGWLVDQSINQSIRRERSDRAPFRVVPLAPWAEFYHTSPCHTERDNI